MHISSVDLNLLVIAATLFRNRNVSKAAQELGLSQSAVSHALSRLRDHFDDPMFVRTSKGVAPTEFARNIQTELLDVVHKTELLVNRKKAFDPKEARGRITLSTTDYFEVVVLPKLQPYLAKEAPGLQLSIRPTMGELPKRELEEGRIDFAIAGFYVDLPEGFYQAKLFKDSFGSATRKEHPRIQGRMTEEQYFKEKHALITLQGDFRDTVGSKKSPRDISYGSYSFTGMAWVLEKSDLVLTAPSLLLKQYQRFFPINVWPCPVRVDPIDIQMIWHAQTHDDPLRVWFREKLRKFCPSGS